MGGEQLAHSPNAAAPPEGGAIGRGGLRENEEGCKGALTVVISTCLLASFFLLSSFFPLRRSLYVCISFLRARKWTDSQRHFL